MNEWSGMLNCSRMVLVPLFINHVLPLVGDWLLWQVVVFTPFLHLFSGIGEVSLFGDVVFGVGSGCSH